MDKNISYGAAGCFAGTLLAFIAIVYNPSPVLVVILPMWGMVMGVSIARVMKTSKKTKKSRKKK